jgi:hypothetical protein
MTEAEWLACTDPEPMLDHLQDRANDRKLRLFAVACCRRVWDRLGGADCQKMVELAERRADGLATDADCDRAVFAHWGFLQAGAWCGELAAAYAASPAALVGLRFAREMLPASAAARAAADHAAVAVGDTGSGNAVWALERAAQAELLRCVLGNPFRPVRIDPAWRTPAVLELAQAVYDARACERLPELADALQAAGCTDADVLEHCRSPGPHVLGCWAVDLVLAKG